MCIFAPHSFKRHNTVLGSTITITTSDKEVNLQKEHLRILRKRFDDCRGFGGGLAFEFKIEMNKNHIIMKRILTILLVTIVLISCQTDSEKADKLRLGNKFDEAAELYQKAADEVMPMLCGDSQMRMPMVMVLIGTRQKPWNY